MKKFLSVVLVLFLLFSITSCGNKDNNNNLNTSNPKSDSEPIPLKEEALPDLSGMGINSVLNFSSIGDKMYIVGKEFLYDLEMSPKTKVLTLDLDGNILEESEINRSMSCVAIDSGGFIWSLEYEWENAGSGSGIVLNCFDTAGKNIKTLNVPDIEYSGVQREFHNIFSIDSDGNFYIVHYDTEWIGGASQWIGSGKIAVVSKAGKFLFDIESTPGYKNEGIYKLADGRIIAQEWSETEFWDYKFKEIDFKSKSLINGINFNYENTSGSLFLFGGNDAYDLLYYDMSDLYGYDIEEGTPAPLINWSEREINGFNNPDRLNPQRVLAIADNIYVIAIESNILNGETVTATKLLKLITADSELLEESNKKEVKLSALYLNQNMLNVIADFNKKSEEYYIKTKSYTNEVNPTFEEEISQFNADLLSGDIPDFIFLDSNMPVESYISKGIFSDLYGYIDSDPDISRDDYLPNILSALERDGRLYTAVPSFGISTIIGKSSDVGESMGWTWDEFYSLLDGKPDDVIPIGYEFSNYTKKNFLEAVLFSDMSGFVDFDEAKANFNGDDFIDFMKIANGYPNENEELPVDSFKYGNPLLMRVDLTIFDHFRIYEDFHFGEEVTIVGFPSDSDNYSSGMAFNRFAITEDGKEKDGAWEFAKYLLTDYQDSIGSLLTGNGLPVRKSSLDSLAETAKTNPVNGNPRMTSVYDGQNWITKEISNNTEEDNQKILNLIGSVNGFTDGNREIIKIAMEEAESYFAGQKSAEEAADIIQNRVSIYLAEIS